MHVRDDAEFQWPTDAKEQQKHENKKLLHSVLVEQRRFFFFFHCLPHSISFFKSTTGMTRWRRIVWRSIFIYIWVGLQRVFHLFFTRELTDWLDSIIFRLQVNSLLGHLFDLIRRLSNGPTADKKRHEKGIVKWWSRPCHPLLWRKKRGEDGQLKSWDRGREEKTMFSLPHLIFYSPWCHWWGMRSRFILHTDSQLLLIALWMVLYVSITKVSFTLSSIFSRWE